MQFITVIIEVSSLFITQLLTAISGAIALVGGGFLAALIAGFVLAGSIAFVSYGPAEAQKPVAKGAAIIGGAAAGGAVGGIIGGMITGATGGAAAGPVGIVAGIIVGGALGWWLSS